MRTVKALDGNEGNFVFPIVIGQIGAASITRNNRTQPCRHNLNTDIVLLIPLSQLSDTLQIQLNNQLRDTRLQNRIHDPLYRADLRNHDNERDYAKLRSRAARRAKDLMADVERQVLEQCVDELANEFELVILDGSLFTPLKEARMPADRANQIVGISKSFSLKPLILMEQLLNRRDCIRQLINLRPGERTDAIELHIENTWVVSWYQRIRPRERVESPLDGIVKVDTHFADYPACESESTRRRFDRNGRNWSAVWDSIANVVYAERLPVPFHEDRWHALLYPVYCCERLLKSSFLSIEMMRGLCSGIIAS